MSKKKRAVFFFFPSFSIEKLAQNHILSLLSLSLVNPFFRPPPSQTESGIINLDGLVGRRLLDAKRKAKGALEKASRERASLQLLFFSVSVEKTLSSTAAVDRRRCFLLRVRPSRDLRAQQDSCLLEDELERSRFGQERGQGMTRRGD